MPARFWQALHGFLVRLWNRAEGHGLSAVTHPDQDAPGVQVRVFRRDEQNFCRVTCLPCALQQFRIHG